jgi:outer membrane protein, adhesin transport system
VDSYLRQFRVGKKSWLDVLNVQRERVQAAASLIDLEYPLQLAHFRLLHSRWCDLPFYRPRATG